MTRRLFHDKIANLSGGTTREQRRREQLKTRKDRWRERRRAGCFIVPIEISEDLLDRLIGAGWLTDEQTYDLPQLASELRGVLELLGRQRRR